MSGIAGVFHLDGSPADLTALHRMGEALAWRGPDGIGYWHSGPVGFAHTRFCTTPESLQEKQPLCSPDASLCVTFDGRIDNRDEILQALRSDGAYPLDGTDPALLLAAYRLWGTDCLQRIVGDFAFALWDQARRTLWCARDHIGIRPFYYVHSPKLFLFSSDIQSLLTNPSVSQAVNEGMVAEHLVFSLCTRDQSLYCDIQRLPSSSTLTLTRDGECRVSSWWRPDFSPIRYNSDAEYAEHFTDLLEQSVTARMRVHGGWGCQLSGGLDSSTVAVTAQTLLDRSGRDQRVQTFSTVSPGKPWDESEYIRATTGLWNFESQCVPPAYFGLEFYREEAARSREFPGYPNSAPMIADVYGAAQKRGVRVLLTGHGGNHLLESSLSHLADLALRGSLLQLARVGRDDWRMYGEVGSCQVFVMRKLLLHLVPNNVRAWRTRQNLNNSTYLFPDFVRRTQLADRIESPPRPEMKDFVSRAQRSMFRMLQGGEVVRAQEFIDRISSKYGIEERHPFFDRRLVEFCLRIPEDQRQRGIVWKWILRTAMMNKLPLLLLNRIGQAEFSEFYFKALSEAEALRTLDTLPGISRTDWIDVSQFQAAIAAFSSIRSMPAALAMRSWMALGIELWLETLTYAF